VLDLPAPLAGQCRDLLDRVPLGRQAGIPSSAPRVHEHLEQVRKAMLKHTLVETDNQIALLTSWLAAISACTLRPSQRVIPVS
jgi:hypothetical protein